jgi:hypothetical protein
VAVFPDKVGVGSVIGIDIASELPAARIVANGPLPPPDRDRSPVVTAGDTLPSGFACSVASSGTQAWLTNFRTGTAERVSVNVPFGFATTESVAVVAVSTFTD